MSHIDIITQTFVTTRSSVCLYEFMSLVDNIIHLSC